MKTSLFSLLLTFSTGMVDATDSIDKINHRYEMIAAEGLLTVHQRHIGELEKEKVKAMASNDLAKATRADDRIKVLKVEIIDLKKKLETLEAGIPQLPENEFYKMTSTAGSSGTEHGRKISFHFERLPLNEFAGDKLVLIVTAAPSKDAETSHAVFVFDEETGKEIGKVSSLGRGQTKEIPISLPPSDSLKLAIAVKGSDALHPKRNETGSPEVFLKITK